MGNYIRRVTLFAIGNTIREEVVTVAIGNYIRRVIVIGGSLYSRVYGTVVHSPAGLYDVRTINLCAR